MKKWILLGLLGFGVHANGHQLTPTYPVLESSHINGVYQTTMNLFNRRDDIEYYQVNVYDQEWNPVAFAISERIIKLSYLERTQFTIYIRNEDKERVKYICTKSKILRDELQSAVVASRICSKIK
jgi:hypothetical protein